MDNSVLNNNITEGQNYNSLDEFKKLKEFPASKPFLLSSIEGVVVFTNNSALNTFGVEEGIKITKINSDPDLGIILHNLVENNYRTFQFEVFVFDAKSEKSINYFVDINRILINNQHYFAINFTSQIEKNKIAKRISNLSNALEYADIPVIIAAETGEISYVSKSFETILAKSIDQLYGKNVVDVFKSSLESLEHSEFVASFRKKENYVKIISDISNTGELWYKELKVNFINQESIGESSVIITANDITNYVTKNRIIQKSEKRQKLIINNISDPLLILRKDEEEIIFENANENFHFMFNLNKVNLKNKPASIMLPADIYEKIYSAIHDAKDYPGEQIEFRYKPESTLREYICKISHADDLYGRGQLFIISFNDITEQLNTEKMLRKAYQQETRLNKLKSAFLANMSHEIRTPLNAVVGYSDLLEDDIQEKNYESLPIILGYLKDGVDRLLGLVGNIVEVSMLEAGDYTIDLNPYHVNSFLIDLESQYHDEAIHKHINFDLDLDPSNPIVNVDEVKFKKVLETIIRNAIKYNKDNGIILISSSHSEEWVTIAITDTGIGIEKDKIQNILEPFMQVEEEGFTRNYEGAGLGLTIAHRLTQLFKGKFEIESQLNEGTTVKIILPVKNVSKINKTN